MTATYTTRAGDILDDIVNRYYGRQDGGLVVFVLEANPGLADYGPRIPAGVLVALPDAPGPDAAQTVQLFQ